MMKNKKFSVKVSYFGSGYYRVLYCSYRWFPLFWKELTFWFEQGVTSNTECWSVYLFHTYKDAEEAARKLNSLEDVHKWYAPYIKKRKLFFEEKKKFFRKNVPYRRKRIK